MAWSASILLIKDCLEYLMITLSGGQKAHFFILQWVVAAVLPNFRTFELLRGSLNYLLWNWLLKLSSFTLLQFSFDLLNAQPALFLKLCWCTFKFQSNSFLPLPWQSFAYNCICLTMNVRLIFKTQTEKSYYKNLFLPTAYDSVPSISSST